MYIKKLSLRIALYAMSFYVVTCLYKKDPKIITLYNFIENVCIVLYCIVLYCQIKQCSFLTACFYFVYAIDNKDNYTLVTLNYRLFLLKLM